MWVSKNDISAYLTRSQKVTLEYRLQTEVHMRDLCELNVRRIYLNVLFGDKEITIISAYKHTYLRKYIAIHR